MVYFITLNMKKWTYQSKIYLSSELKASMEVWSILNYTRLCFLMTLKNISKLSSVLYMHLPTLALTVLTCAPIFFLRLFFILSIWITWNTTHINLFISKSIWLAQNTRRINSFSKWVETIASKPMTWRKYNRAPTVLLLKESIII